MPLSSTFRLQGGQVRRGSVRRRCIAPLRQGISLTYRRRTYCYKAGGVNLARSLRDIPEQRMPPEASTNSQTASVNAAFDAMERQMGSRTFRDLFKSITADNGTEFSDVRTLERSALCSQPRTRLYFAHPYSSSERGTNENHNGILRRFIPKASDIGLMSKKAVQGT